MPAPFEVIAAPVTLWLAPTGTAFPLINVAPAVAWVKVGTSGELNYDEVGVVVNHGQTIVQWRSLGDGTTRKVFRTDETLQVGLTLVDLTLEQYALALNANTVSTTAPGVGVAGFKKVGLSRGIDVAQKALLVRGPSPYGDGWNLQYEVPFAFQTGNPTPTFRKGEPAGLALEWTVIADPSASASERFGRLVAQNANPS
jgi:hypothetical protein